ncbi:MAG: dicarboxylate/amino acid:cation symporter [Candidatus Zixiibacteriota bacterium]
MERSLPKKMAWGLFVGALLGVAAYLTAPGSEALAGFIAYVTKPMGQIFLRLLFMLVIPLVFSALALGVAGVGNPRRLGRIGLLTLAYTVSVSAIAVLIGVFLVNTIRPGAGLSAESKAQLLQGAGDRAASIIQSPQTQRTGLDLLIQIVPDNPIRAATEMDMLAVMFFALAIGIGITLTGTEAARRFTDTLQGLYDITMRLIGLVISLAPYGVGALIFTLTAQMGYEALVHLAKYVLVVLLAMAIHQFGIYSLVLSTLARINPLRFFRDVQPATLTAFSTASSNATLPTTLRVAEENLKLPSAVSRFVLTIGSTANQNGTALFEGMTVLFLAQFYDVPLTIAQQVIVVGICILGGIGTAGIPAGSLPVVAMILGLIHVPVEGLGLILGVDRFLDMCRTTLNVTGDLVGAAVISRYSPPPAIDQ